MRFASLLMTHLDTELTRDTLESIQCYMTKDNLILVDGKYWPTFANVDFGCPIMKGLEHGHSCSPYKNQLIGFQRLRKLYPDADWYAYVENDVLFASDQFKADLEKANRDIWAAGFDLREMYAPWHLLSARLGIKVLHHVIMIGCCQFYRRELFERLEELNFTDNFLALTAPYGPVFPDYNHIAVEEGLLPSMCKSFGKATLQLANWEIGYNRHQYGIRFRPLWEMHEMAHNYSIIHPIKEVNAIRLKYKKVRDFISKGVVATTNDQQSPSSAPNE